MITTNNILICINPTKYKDFDIIAIGDIKQLQLLLELLMTIGIMHLV